MRCLYGKAAFKLILVLGALLQAVGCSHLVIPNAVPAVENSKEDELVLSGSALDIVSVETDNTNFLIYQSARHGSFFGNRKLWCDKLVTALSSELHKRGANIIPTAATRFQLALSEISGRSGYATIGFQARATVTSTAGWSKTYEGQASAAAGMSPRSIAARSANYTVADLVKAMLADPEFISQIKGSKP